jgi:hypothetical protein
MMIVTMPPVLGSVLCHVPARDARLRFAALTMAGPVRTVINAKTIADLLMRPIFSPFSFPEVSPLSISLMKHLPEFLQSGQRWYFKDGHGVFFGQDSKQKSFSYRVIQVKCKTT